jgi:pantoate--beta-alanine ligase
MRTIASPQEMVRWAEGQVGATIGLVPTMGSLHRGHTSLMALLRPRVDQLVASVYVNPLQFAPHEDLARYPRDLEADSKVCAAEGVNVLFAPADLYPDGFATSVAVHGLTERWDGAARPGHFEGVATVCARLFGLTRCTVAAFGEKDWQQLLVVRRMVEDLALPLRIVAGPLVRDDDGLALSSRNVYLSPEERRRGLSLSRALHAMQQRAERGETSARALVELGRGTLDCDRLDYLAVTDAETLKPLDEVGDRPARVLVAAWIGSTRLIDNVPIGRELAWT